MRRTFWEGAKSRIDVRPVGRTLGVIRKADAAAKPRFAGRRKSCRKSGDLPLPNSVTPLRGFTKRDTGIVSLMTKFNTRSRIVWRVETASREMSLAPCATVLCAVRDYLPVACSVAGQQSLRGRIHRNDRASLRGRQPSTFLCARAIDFSKISFGSYRAAE
jgi:hypothetical protein